VAAIQLTFTYKQYTEYTEQNIFVLPVFTAVDEQFCGTIVVELRFSKTQKRYKVTNN
jgi:hypothetical protein